MTVTVKIPSAMQTQNVDQIDLNWDQDTTVFSFYSEKYLNENNMPNPMPEWENLGGTRNVTVPGDTITLTTILDVFAQVAGVINVEYVA